MGLLHTILIDLKSSDIFTTLSFAICFYIFHYYYKHFTRPNPLPGPLPIPLIGSVAIFKGDIDAWFNELNKIYGRDGLYEVNIAGNRQIVITRAEYIDKFLTASVTNHVMRTANNGQLEVFDLATKGVGLNHDRGYWKFNRHIFSQAFMPLSASPDTMKTLNKLFTEMSNYWMDSKNKGDDATIVDISNWMRRFTCDFISVLATGKQIRALNNYHRKLKNEDVTKEVMVTENFVECINIFFSDNQMLFIPWILRTIPFMKTRVNRLLNACHFIYGTLVDMIRKRRKEIEKTGIIGDENQLDLLTSLIIANTPHDTRPQKNLEPKLQRPMTDDEVRGVMFDAFVAGTDTTVNTFCFVLYYITHNPDVKRKMLEEIQTVFKDDPNRPITLDDLENLRYCEAIIKETSRIRPTVTMVSRYSNKPDEVAGLKWPANILFIMYVRGINNNPLYWKNPEKFMPERFYEPHEIENQHKNSFLMFGGGSRACLGRKVAIVELKTLLALLYRNFDVELVDKRANLDVETSTITICKELDIKIVPREKII